uniref:ribonuclease H n=1 Tax=Eptatretus burgeri TaxID=7764 RepID=A0A8C4Q2Z7_EPTBU
MEIDTGAAVSLMSEAAFCNMWGNSEQPSLRWSPIQLTAYCSESIQARWSCDVTVTYGNNTYELQLLIIPGDGPTLHGRNWLDVVKLNWEHIHRLQASKPPTVLQHLLARYPDVFKDELGTLKGFTAKLNIEKDAKPIFSKAHPVPFALQEKVDAELARLEKLGIIESVQYSNWAAPVVPVVKADKSIRLCGDYKMSINKCSTLDKYPIPRIDDLSAKLSGGQSFTKLDMRSADLQVVLHEDSKGYLIINTHRGLYRYNRLSFGVKSAPGIYQSCMDSLFAAEPHVVVYQDDILVTGRSELHHRDNLERVLRIISDSGVRLRRDKCEFMVPSVTYLGHRIDAEGLHPTEENIRAIKDAPAPTNNSELKANIGMLQYYSRYLPNIATMLGLLNCLLKKASAGNGTFQRHQPSRNQKTCCSLQMCEFTTTHTKTCSCRLMRVSTGLVPFCHTSCQIAQRDQSHSHLVHCPQLRRTTVSWTKKDLAFYLELRHFTSTSSVDISRFTWTTNH